MVKITVRRLFEECATETRHITITTQSFSRLCLFSEVSSDNFAFGRSKSKVYLHRIRKRGAGPSRERAHSRSGTPSCDEVDTRPSRHAEKSNISIFTKKNNGLEKLQHGQN